MAKPVGSRCNMRCSYCYYLDKGKYSSSAVQSRMSDNVLEQMIKQTIELSGGPVVSFTWHGGEPTLAGIEFYRKAVELEKKYLPAGWQVWNNLQTNGLRISEEWCRFLKENRFDVGVSIDGSSQIHDRNRHTVNGDGTYNKVIRGIKLLKSAGIEPDLLCTVNSATAADPLGAYRALRDTNCGWIQFIPIVVRRPDGYLSKQSVNGDDYGRFLCAVFDEWAKHDIGRLDVQLFAEMARVMAGGEASLCWMSRTCGRVLIAEEDGSIYSCDHFVDGDHRLGNIKTDELGSLLDSDRQMVFGNSKETGLTSECRDCPYLKYCNGGCPKDRFGVSSDEEEGQYILCAGLKAFFSHAEPVMRRIMELSSEGMKPDEIMNSL